MIKLALCVFDILSYCSLMRHFVHLLTTCVTRDLDHTLVWHHVRPSTPRNREIPLVYKTQYTMFYVEVESAAVPVVSTNHARHHKIYVRVTIVCTRNLLKNERYLLKNDVCVSVVHNH